MVKCAQKDVYETIMLDGFVKSLQIGLVVTFGPAVGGTKFASLRTFL
jgi:hypothetical protein